MKLAPVLTELVKPIAGVEVVQRGISVENIADRRRSGQTRHSWRGSPLRRTSWKQDGTLQRIRRKWLGNPYADQSLAVH